MGKSGCCTRCIKWQAEQEEMRAGARMGVGVGVEHPGVQWQADTSSISHGGNAEFRAFPPLAIRGGARSSIPEP